MLNGQRLVAVGACWFGGHVRAAHRAFTRVVTRAAYVAISRAREGTVTYTDSRAKLTEALGFRDGAQVGAIDEAMERESNLEYGT